MIKGSSIFRLCSCIASIVFTTTIQAGGIMLYEVGSDDVGLASAGYSARAQDPSTMLTNPAGMTRLEGKQLFVGVQALYEDIEFSPATASPFLGTENGGNPVNVFPGGSFFYSYSISDDLKAGIGVYGNFGSVLKYHGDWVGRYSTVKATLIGTSIQPTIAYRVSEGLSIGAGPIFMYGSLRSKTRINNSPFQLFNFHDGELSLSDRTWGVGANIGALYEFNPCTRLGLSYTSDIKLNFSPDAVFTDLALPLNTVLGNRGLLNSQIDIGITVPQSVMASLFHQWDQEWAFLASFGWQDWEKFGEVDVGISSINPVSLTINKNYKDTWHVAAGIQHWLNERCLFNAGIGYDSRFQNPVDIPASTPVNSAWRYAIGTHFSANKQIDMGVALEYIYGGTLDVNHNGAITGVYTGEFKHVGVYFLALNLNWKCV
ncbi:MAG: OmpP1/FadL family transporter [Candidatus Berkiella sp.]